MQDASGLPRPFSHATVYADRFGSYEAHTNWQRDKINEIIKFTNEKIDVILAPGYMMEGVDPNRRFSNCYAEKELKALGELSTSLINAVVSFKRENSP